MRRDSRVKYDSSMEEYLIDYGYHFNKKLFDFAVSLMEDRDGNPLEPWSKEQTNIFLSRFGVELVHNFGHDAAYVLNMARADYYGSSITEEPKLASYVKDYIDDIDGSDTRAFDEFFIGCMAKGIPIFWDEML